MDNGGARSGAFSAIRPSVRVSSVAELPVASGDGVLGNCFLAMRIFLLRNPDGDDPKKMVDDPNLVCEKKTKTETQKSRAIH
jgi:hypothetical protein